MSPTPRNPWSDLNVGIKLTFIPLFFILILAGVLYSTISTSRDQQGNIEIVEKVGRQRMLQQQHFATALLIIQNKTTRERLDYIRKAWLDGQKALTYGGPILVRLNYPETMDMPAAPSEYLRGLLQSQTQLINDSVQDIDRLITTAPDAAGYDELLNNLLAKEAEIQDLGIEIARGFTRHMEDQVEELIKTQSGVAAVAALLSFLFSWFIARSISQPLQSVVESANSIATGNLRISKLEVNSSDEIGRLGASFNNMLDNLKELSGQILNVTGNINSAAAEILASTQQQASSTKEQAATVHEISATMQEISQSGNEITDKAKQVAATAEATSAAGESGINAVKTTSRLMEGIRQQVEDVATRIVALSERTQAIGEIVSTVNEIAEQSNLLALNASIEAASAGEQGNRFAVVAGEMRNLAQRAKESTVQVGSILGEIQRGINSTVMMTEEAVKRSDSGKQQAEITEQTIHQMTRTTVESVHAFQQIIASTSQQQIGFDQVTQGMRDIRQATEQTAIGTSQLEKALANLNELSLQLRTAVSRYQV
ncbi:Methyl-accepting chemotaxis protein [Prosthecobacter debontii]|uniref:Methyl-accepting chemotaxis protein n=1 Tax=Prosthecobacter debontii TaxID=48467 RepID=A0A1T4WWV3_9BACT|nr:methyl-accepting chemotaxis protein [Prosthecobacter debontii]SKA81719.1 Methyl-accepting chemotaxis protein [Prosthecobacter debontii]